jgi:type IV pilus assembly protein PilB
MTTSQSIEDLLGRLKDGIQDHEPTVTEKLEEKMTELRLKEKEKDTERKAQSSGVPYVNLKGFPISPEALRLISRAQAKELSVIPFINTGSDIRLGAIDPSSSAIHELLYQLEERTKARGGLYQISQESLQVGLATYDTLPIIKPIIKGVAIEEEELKKYEAQFRSYADIQQIMQSSSVSDLMTVALAAAIHFNSSDVHIEAEEQVIVMRFRIDGVLQDVATLDHELWKKIVSRIKLISGLKINITEKPQDGRFTIFLSGGNTDVRVSTIPTTWGESVVMRILRSDAIQVEFSKLGYRAPVEKKLLTELQKPHGMILTTGPTGSGKTTTLYAMLRLLNQPDVKIITLEDPIEYKLEGINQSQIDHTREYTFATGLRSVLRQDPDVVMVGEIRDNETADIAINAALTGHLMLSTLHTNEAAGAIPRLIAMGAKPFLLAPALNAIIAQRLVRRIHDACKEEIELTEEQKELIKNILADLPKASGETPPAPEQWKLYQGKGCEACNHTGYQGRIGLYEIIVMTEEIKAALSETISEYQMKELAKTQGMITMRQDGILKVLDGLTTLKEVDRTTMK